MEKFTVVICTYNRQELLGDCLDAILAVSDDHALFRFLVVDNNSNDETADIVKTYQTSFNGKLDYALETEQGLSHARNRGMNEVGTEWIIYLDDDAKVDTKFFKSIIQTSQTSDIKVFGGVYFPWYKYGKPKWYKKSYGSNEMPYKSLKVLPKTRTLSGGIMCFKNDFLKSYNGFLTSLGMNGVTIGYGEESELQNRMHNDGVKIYYDPAIIIYHVVAEYKLKVQWHLDSYLALGKNLVDTENIKPSIFSVVKQSILMVGTFVFKFVASTPKLLMRNYYRENWKIDVFRKPQKRWGAVKEILRRRKKM